MFLTSLLNLKQPQSTPSALPEWARDVRLVRSARAKRIALRLDPAKGDVCLIVPTRASEAKAWAFAAKNTDWIASQQAKIIKPTAFTHGAQIPILGTLRTITVQPTTARATSFELLPDRLIVKTNRENPANNIRQYLYRFLQETVHPMATAKAATINRTITAIDLRDTRTRWGSCGHDGRVMLCWRLVFAPLDVIDYVVAHEIAHLQHMDHSPNFWALCQSLSANFEARDWLKQNGDTLLRYGA